jgi:hypothetical protein
MEPKNEEQIQLPLAASDGDPDAADRFVYELVSGREPWPAVLDRWGIKWQGRHSK